MFPGVARANSTPPRDTRKLESSYEASGKYDSYRDFDHNRRLGVPRRSQSPSAHPVSHNVSPPHSRTIVSSDDSLLGKKNSNGTDDEDDDEDVEIKISPTGSVLSPSPNPYDKTQKIRQANAQLMASRLPPKPPGKVRFNESVVAAEEPGDHAIRSKKPKTTVTMPPTLKKN